MLRQPLFYNRHRFWRSCPLSYPRCRNPISPGDIDASGRCPAAYSLGSLTSRIIACPSYQLLPSRPLLNLLDLRLRLIYPLFHDGRFPSVNLRLLLSERQACHWKNEHERNIQTNIFFFIIFHLLLSTFFRIPRSLPVRQRAQSAIEIASSSCCKSKGLPDSIDSCP